MKVYDAPNPGKNAKVYQKTGMYKQILVYSYHGILFNKKKNGQLLHVQHR